MEMIKEVLDIQAEREKEEEERNAFRRGMGGVHSGAEVTISWGEVIGNLGSITFTNERDEGEPYTIGSDSSRSEDHSAFAMATSYEGRLTMHSAIIDEEFHNLLTESIDRELSMSIARGGNPNWFDEMSEPYKGRAERRKKRKGTHFENKDRQQLSKMLGGRKHWK